MDPGVSKLLPPFAGTGLLQVRFATLVAQSHGENGDHPPFTLSGFCSLTSLIFFFPSRIGHTMSPFGVVMKRSCWRHVTPEISVGPSRTLARDVVSEELT